MYSLFGCKKQSNANVNECKADITKEGSIATDKSNILQTENKECVPKTSTDDESSKGLCPNIRISSDITEASNSSDPKEENKHSQSPHKNTRISIISKLGSMDESEMSKYCENNLSKRNIEADHEVIDLTKEKDDVKEGKEAENNHKSSSTDDECASDNQEDQEEESKVASRKENIAKVETINDSISSKSLTTEKDSLQSQLSTNNNETKPNGDQIKTSNTDVNIINKHNLLDNCCIKSSDNTHNNSNNDSFKDDTHKKEKEEENVETTALTPHIRQPATKTDIDQPICDEVINSTSDSDDNFKRLCLEDKTNNWNIAADEEEMNAKPCESTLSIDATLETAAKVLENLGTEVITDTSLQVTESLEGNYLSQTLTQDEEVVVEKSSDERSEQFDPNASAFAEELEIEVEQKVANIINDACDSAVEMMNLSMTQEDNEGVEQEKNEQPEFNRRTEGATIAWNEESDDERTSQTKADEIIESSFDKPHISMNDDFMVALEDLNVSRIVHDATSLELVDIESTENDETDLQITLRDELRRSVKGTYGNGGNIIDRSQSLRNVLVGEEGGEKALERQDSRPLSAKSQT